MKAAASLNLDVRYFRVITIAVLAITLGAVNHSVVGQSPGQLTPIQREIESQRRRLTSTDIEERRDALMRLGSLKRPDASQVATAGLGDAAPIVRVAAMQAILSLPDAQIVSLLAPFLKDKSEFVRREAAYALGSSHSHAATSSLMNTLANDKEASVRAAAAVALGEVRDESAVPPLTQILAGRSDNKKKKAESKENVFVLRAAARSLGQIRSRAAVEILIATLGNDGNDNDVRREAATALGLIGDASAGPALQTALGSSDPYLAEAARESLRLIRRSVRSEARP